MSLVPFIMMGKGGKGGADVGEGLAMLIASPLIAAGKIGEGFEKIKDAIVQRAQLRANKKEFEEITEQYAKLSEGKVGTVETFKNEEDNSITTVLHTENGPFTRIEKTGKVVHSRDGSSFVKGSSVSYSGLREVVDQHGNTTLAFINDVTVATSQPFNNNNKEDIVAFNTSGTILTETGLKSNYEDVTSVFEGQPAPTGGAFAVTEGLAADFAAELAKVQVATQGTANTTVVDTTPEA